MPNRGMSRRSSRVRVPPLPPSSLAFLGPRCASLRVVQGHTRLRSPPPSPCTDETRSAGTRQTYRTWVSPQATGTRATSRRTSCGQRSRRDEAPLRRFGLWSGLRNDEVAVSERLDRRLHSPEANAVEVGIDETTVLHVPDGCTVAIRSYGQELHSIRGEIRRTCVCVPSLEALSEKKTEERDGDEADCDCGLQHTGLP